MCLFNMFAPLKPPLYLLGLCICHAGQTFGGEEETHTHTHTHLFLCPSSTQTSFVLCFLSHFGDFPSQPVLLRSPRVSITDRAGGGRVSSQSAGPAIGSSLPFLFPYVSKRAIRLENTSLWKHAYPSGAARRFGFITCSFTMRTNKRAEPPPNPPPPFPVCYLRVRSKQSKSGAKPQCKEPRAACKAALCLLAVGF